MGMKRESTSNTNSDAVVSSVALNNTTAVVLLAADIERLFFEINNNDSTKDFWVRFYPAATDNIKQGIFITSKTGSRTSFQMLRATMYTGEISAIADTDSPTAFITSF